MNHDIIKINDLEFPALVAVTSDEQNRGLMFQKWPPPVMAFPSKNASFKKFWMKNTPSALDIVFCNAGKIISICEGVPYSTAMVGPNKQSDLVIEFPRGTMESFDIRVDDHVSFQPTLKTANRMLTALAI